jgi:predicted MFS family arabinose efflux permease
MHRTRIRLFAAATFIYWAALFIYVPTLPAYVKGRAASLTEVGVVLSMFGLWEAILRTPLGIIVDATGRRKRFLLGGFLAAALGALVMARGSSVGALTFGRALTGASSAIWAPMIVVFSGYYPAEKTVFATSLIALLCSLGQMLATGCTGFLNAAGGYPLAFYVSAALAVIATVVLAVTPLPPRAGGRARVSALSILSVFVRKDVLIPSFANAICQLGGWAVLYGFLPLLARQLGASQVAIGLLVTAALAANTATNLIVTLAVRDGRTRAILHGSFFLFAAGIFAAAAARSIPVLFLATIGMGGANGFFFPLLMGLSIEQVDGAHRSTAMGIHQAVYAVGMFVGPWIGGIIADAIGIRSMFGVIAVFCLIATNVLIRFHPVRLRTGSGSDTLAAEAREALR